MLLASLPKKYNTVITNLLVGKRTVTLDETIVVLLEPKKLMKQGVGGSSDDGGTFVVDYRAKKKGGWKMHNLNINCFYCEIDDGELLMVHGEMEPKESWVLDSGTSYHICGKKEWFSSYEECEGKMISLPNGDKAKIEGIGEVKELALKAVMALYVTR
ncbi:uncharacterized protein LOC141588502 [Silene latifolia]|uniref:uncharacterized protein LOC141588502 n=1 Tax=Silene latifolia TaxID=37657 RepID=UPI003D775B13